MTANDHYYTVPQFAKALGVNASKVLTWIHAGDLEAVDVSAKPGSGRPRWRISREALERFERSRSSYSKAQKPATPRRRRSSATVPQYV